MLWFFNFILYVFVEISNEIFPPAKFDNPFRFEQVLSASFGEPRSSSFHTGIDIRTFGRIGDSVFAVEEGYVSRVFVSPYGYGKAIYINHPNGYTSVYAHLNNFSDDVASFIRDHQYRTERFDVDIALEKHLFPIKKGQLIGFAGNSGSSAGPHLHFEIRSTITEMPVDPLMFYFDIKDDIAPEFSNIYFYPKTPESHVEQDNRLKGKPLIKANGYYRLSDGDTISAYGLIGIGAHVTDRITGSNNICGINRLTMKVNQSTVYDFIQDRLSFSHVRYVLSHTDFSLNRRFKKTVHKCFVEPGNKLPNYRQLVNRGLINVEPGKFYQIEIEASDSRKNKSRVRFVIAGVGTSGTIPSKKNYRAVWIPNMANRYSDSTLSVSLPADAIYDTIFFDYEVKKPQHPFVSRLYSIGNPDIPLHKNIEIVFHNEKIPQKWQPYLVLVNATDKNLDVLDVSPKMVDDKIIAKIRTFTTVAFAVDTVPPRILPINLADGASLNGQTSKK
ncbi:MAG TPA: M23 family metallopeptidase [Salinivirgaceae bacterium]|nr:M23 family metallopeptidase [Salinivirgaceae bacterium]